MLVLYFWTCSQQLLVHCDTEIDATRFLELNLLNVFIANIGKSVFVYLLIVILTKHLDLQ